MDWMRQYILSIIACAILSSIVRSVAPKGGTRGTLVKLITGLFITVTAISPLIGLNISNVSAHIKSLDTTSNIYTEAGQEKAEDAIKTIIKQQTEAYILDKAASLSADISVNVQLDTEHMVPTEISIDGDISPYAKETLSLYMEDSIGVPKEKQLWN